MKICHFYFFDINGNRIDQFQFFGQNEYSQSASIIQIQMLGEISPFPVIQNQKVVGDFHRQRYCTCLSWIRRLKYFIFNRAILFNRNSALIFLSRIKQLVSAIIISEIFDIPF